LDCAIAAEAAKTITDASKVDVIFLIATSRELTASFLRGVFVVGAIMPQPACSGKPTVISAKRNDYRGKFTSASFRDAPSSGADPESSTNTALDFRVPAIQVGCCRLGQ
jgi:hypothetical protein